MKQKLESSVTFAPFKARVHLFYKIKRLLLHEAVVTSASQTLKNLLFGGRESIRAAQQESFQSNLTSEKPTRDRSASWV